MSAASTATGNLQETSPEVAFEPDEEVIKLLAEIGLSAASLGHGEAAAPIFDAVALFKPDNPVATIGRAVADIANGKPDEALRSLQNAGAMRESGSDELKAVALIASSLAGRLDDASLLCRRLLNSGSGPSRQIAMRLRPLIDAGLKA